MSLKRFYCTIQCRIRQNTSVTPLGAVKLTCRTMGEILICLPVMINRADSMIDSTCLYLLWTTRTTFAATVLGLQYLGSNSLRIKRIMFSAVSYIVVLLCLTIGHSSGQSPEFEAPVCSSRFDWDYKVLQKLSDLDSEIKALKSQVSTEGIKGMFSI